MEEYLRIAFEELFEEDGLTVMGKGLGIFDLFSKFVRLYSGVAYRRKLVLCLNANEQAELLQKSLLADGVSPHHIPKVITNEINSVERSELYANGGCYCITSRILIVDLLDGKLDPALIFGLLVFDAHRVNDTSIESFIIRVYRHKNRTGFIKAFSDEPDQLSTGISKTEKLLKLLYVRRLYLWPRFKLEIARVLASSPPAVIELSQPLTPCMQAVQSAILVAMKSCVEEIRKSAPQIDSSFQPQLTLENAVFKSFDYSLRSHLETEWHRTTAKTKQLLNDVTQLRKLLEYLLRYDACSFYSFLLSLKSLSAANQVSPSLWLSTDAAELLFLKARDRLFKFVDRTKQPLKTKKLAAGPMLSDGSLQLVAIKECPPKWSLLVSVIEEINKDIQLLRETTTIEASSRISNANRIVVLVRDSRTSIQLCDVINCGTEYVCDQRHRWIVSQLAAEIRNKAKAKSLRPGNSFGGSSKPPPSSHSLQQPASAGAMSLKPWQQQQLRAMGELPVNSRPPQLVEPVYIDLQQIQTEQSRDVVSNSNSYGNEISDLLDIGLTQDQFSCLSSENKLILLHERDLKATPTMLPRGLAANASPMNANSNSNCNPGAAAATSDAISEIPVQLPVSKIAQPTAHASESRTLNIPDDGGDSDDATSVIRQTRKRFHMDAKEDDDDVDFLPQALPRSSMISGVGNKRGNQAKGTKSRPAAGFLGKETSTEAISRKRKIEELPSASSIGTFSERAANVKSDDIFDDDHEESTTRNTCTASMSFLEDSDSIIVLTHDDAIVMGDAFGELLPRFVILYDAEVDIIRMLEVHASRGHQVNVYLLAYEESSEEHRYVGRLAREKKAFESLISIKADMVISLPDHAEDLARERRADFDISMDTRTRNLGAGAISGHNGAFRKPGGSSAGSSSSRARSSYEVVVDVREFRSALPSLLHAQGFSIIPRTLQVADFVIASEICIERKGISDLFQSFASGRLYTQAESMSRYYKYPCLLIEFSPDRSMVLQSPNEISSDTIHANSISSRLSILALAFPNLRYLWSRSPHATGDIFRAIMANQEPVDVEKAVTVGAPSAAALSDGGIIADADREAQLTALEMLNALPGVTAMNARAVMGLADSIAELSELSVADLTPAMGAINARKLVQFFKQRFLH